MLKAVDVWPVISKGGTARMSDTKPAKFKLGDQVIAKRMNSSGHIRLPEYVQGHIGQIEKDYGVFIFPDKHAAGVKVAERLYSVRFEASQLWGRERCGTDAVFVDLFESYLTVA